MYPKVWPRRGPADSKLLFKYVKHSNWHRSEDQAAIKSAEAGIDFKKLVIKTLKPTEVANVPSISSCCAYSQISCIVEPDVKYSYSGVSMVYSQVDAQLYAINVF